MTHYTKQQLIDLNIIEFDSLLYDELYDVHYRAIFYEVDKEDAHEFEVSFIVDDICYASDLNF